MAREAKTAQGRAEAGGLGSYFPGIPERDLPRYILVSDFAHLRLYDLENDLHWDIALFELYQQYTSLSPAGKQAKRKCMPGKMM